MAYLVISSRRPGTPRPPAKVHVRGNQASFTTPYYKGWAVDEFKNSVPWQARRWDEGTKTWSCKVEYLEQMTEFADCFGDVKIIKDAAQ